MRRLVVALALALMAILPTRARAQGDDGHVVLRVGSVALESHRLNCDPLTRVFDPVWLNGWGWTMPRAGWWVLYPSAGVAGTEVLTRLGVNDYVAASLMFLALEAIPTGRQGYLATRSGGVWRLNVLDKLGDIHGRLLPFLYVARKHRQPRPHEIARWVAVEALSECVKRP